MKKLIVVVSAVLLSAMAGAANIKWGFNNDGDYLNKSGDAFTTGTAFLYLGTITASDTAFDLSSATFVTASGYDGDQEYFGSVSEMVDEAAVTSTAGGQAFSLLLFDREDMTASDLANFEGDYVLYTGTSAARSEPGATPTPYAEFYRNGDVTASDWSTMSVPEPTSGLLLILGMAGLALRRKHA